MITKLRIILAAEAAVFILAALIHGGILLDGYEHREASIAEAMIAAVLLTGIEASWVWPAQTTRAAVVAQGLALLGTLVGIFTMIIGLGPRTGPDVVYHVLIASILAWGLATAMRTRSDAASTEV